MNSHLGMNCGSRFIGKTKLKRDAPPFIPKSRTLNSSREEQKLSSLLKPSAPPFIPRNRSAQYSAVELPLYHAIPFYQPFDCMDFPLYLPRQITIHTHQQPTLRLQVTLPEITQNNDEAELEELASIIVSEIESEPEAGADLNSSFDSDADLTDHLILERDDEDVVLPKTLINELTDFIPVRKFGEAELNDVCSVCLECFVAEDLVKILECKHGFHQKCIDPWLKKTLKCPLCRHMLI
eukprot:TRINITY_DN6315_c0_g2_i1.p1 TRINITY_DN6315_c0_g2~~TRINITY_DN6315_c0_g2_i1.p1  ORF type:complete len:238 (-),score=24.89 TRINITY_DN6315_c0_g2_i1:181-894(-)